MSGQANVFKPIDPQDFRFSLRAILIAFVVIAPILWLAATMANHSKKHQAEIAAQTKAIWKTLEEAVNTAEQIRTSQGRAPSDAAEIEAAMGGPLRVRVSREHWRDIQYRKTSPGSYELSLLIEWVEGFGCDILLFDSNKPGAGWTQICN